MIKKYIQYLQDNPKGYWFKRKLFGWGWTPATWQGLVTTLLLLGFVIWQAICIEVQFGPEPDSKIMLIFIIKIFVAAVIFSVIAYKKGEEPKWQWGFPNKDKE